jgi:hypothetical protein
VRSIAGVGDVRNVDEIIGECGDVNIAVRKSKEVVRLKIAAVEGKKTKG